MIPYKFTVFTPTYNRAHTLHRVYESLHAQTFRDFEWLVIDDGSMDKTKEMIQKWQNESSFVIRYFYQKNQGKHIAFNYAVSLAQGEFFLPADSDDRFSENALSEFYQTWLSIKDKALYSGVTALCADAMTKTIIGDQFPEDCFDSTTLETTYMHKIRGEKWGFHRTEILKHFPFPKIENSKFIPESFVWTVIARQYKTRYINRVLRYYYQHASSLTHQRCEHSAGLLAWYLFDLNVNFDYLCMDAKNLFKCLVNIGRMQLISQYSIFAVIKRIVHPLRKLLFIGCYPLAYGYYLVKDKRTKEC